MSSGRRHLVVVGVSLLVVTSATALGAPAERFALRYVAPDGQSRCPSQSVLAADVARRLGRSPWSAGARRRLEVSIVRADDKLNARVVLRKSDGRIAGQRELSAALGECRELGDAIALAVSIAIDPSRALAAPPPKTRRPRVAPAKKTATRTAAATRAAQRPPSPRIARRGQAAGAKIAWSVRSAFHLAVGAEPAASPGVTLQLAIKRGWLRLALEGRLDGKSSDALGGGGAVDAMLIGAAALGCGHWRWLFGCAGVTVGALRGGGAGLSDATRVSSLYVAPIVRGGAHVVLFWRMFAYGFAQLDVPLVRARYLETSSGAQLWRASAVAGAFGAGRGVEVW